MSIYKDIIKVLDQQTFDRTPKEIEKILNNVQSKIGSKSISKMIEALNKEGIKAVKTLGRYRDKNAIEVEGQFFEYEGSKNGWVWRSGASNQTSLGSQPKNTSFWNKRKGDPSKVDTSKLPSDEEYLEKRRNRIKYKYNEDPLRGGWIGGGAEGVSSLKDKKRNIEYYTKALEKAKKEYEKKSGKV